MVTKKQTQTNLKTNPQTPKQAVSIIHDSAIPYKIFMFTELRLRVWILDLYSISANY